MDIKLEKALVLFLKMRLPRLTIRKQNIKDNVITISWAKIIFTGTDNLFGKIVNWSVVFISRLECTCCATSRFSVFSPNICDGRPIKANLQTTNWIFLDTGDVSGDFFKLVNKELFTSTKCRNKLANGRRASALVSGPSGLGSSPVFLV